MNFLTGCVLIYDKVKNAFVDKTEKVVSITYNQASCTYNIKFSNASHIYEYNYANVKWLQKPDTIKPDDYLIYIKGKLQSKIAVIANFKTWIHFQLTDGSFKTASSRDVKLIKNHKNEPKYKDFISYLTEIASGIDDLKDDLEDEGILARELKSLPIFEDSVLSDFIADKPIRRLPNDTKELIFPFSTNLSQIAAIEKALSFNISIIQGPPGTGKTQTILNLIANLIYRGKTIAVVSGNNEAIRNIEEKLKKEHLDFFGAFLGKKENITNFFNEPHPLPMITAQMTERDKLNFKIASQRIIDIYRTQEEIAQLQKQLLEIESEKRNYSDEQTEFQGYSAEQLLGKINKEKVIGAIKFLNDLTSIPTLRFISFIKICFHFSFKRARWIINHINETLDILHRAAYKLMEEELKSKQEHLDSILRTTNQKAVEENLRTISRKLLLMKLEKQYSKITDFPFDCYSYKMFFNRFLKRFPLIYSTTNSIHACSEKKYRYDYLLVDESSQINLATAAIAMAVAKNIVFVGDPMQLPHVIKTSDKQFLHDTFSKYKLPSYDDFAKNSILDVMQKKYKDKIPFTLLNIHYRSDPEIINFCNKMFYHDLLLINRKHKDENGIRIITHDGHFCWNRTNDREIEIIKREILPELKEKDIGIIAPFRNQVELLQQNINNAPITIDTVHKFQGKERDVILLSATSDQLRQTNPGEEETTDFINNPNLINVAISRAKNKLYIVASKRLLSQRGLFKDLADYVQYYSTNEQPSIRDTIVHSIFDILYKEDALKKAELDGELVKISKFPSENLIATLLVNIKKSNTIIPFDFVHNYPLHLLFDAESFSSIEERRFISHPSSHLDFLLYKKIGKKPFLAIEVDGKQHRFNDQAYRDSLKNRILSEAKIPLLRISTTEIDCQAKIMSAIKDSLKQ